MEPVSSWILAGLISIEPQQELPYIHYFKPSYSNPVSIANSILQTQRC